MQQPRSAIRSVPRDDHLEMLRREVKQMHAQNQAQRLEFAKALEEQKHMSLAAVNSVQQEAHKKMAIQVEQLADLNALKEQLRDVTGKIFFYFESFNLIKKF